MEDKVATIALQDDWIAVEPEEKLEKTNGGILIPDMAIKKPTVGVIRYVGPGKFNDDGSRRPMDLKPGYKVTFQWGSGEKHVIDDVELLLMHRNDVRFTHCVDTETTVSDKPETNYQ